MIMGMMYYALQKRLNGLQLDIEWYIENHKTDKPKIVEKNKCIENSEKERLLVKCARASSLRG